MALQLSCRCASLDPTTTPDLPLCEPYKMELQARTSYWWDETHEAICELQLFVPGTDAIIHIPAGISHDYPRLDSPWVASNVVLEPFDFWLSHFGSMRIAFGGGATITQRPPFPASTSRATFTIKTYYRCTDPATGVVLPGDRFLWSLNEKAINGTCPGFEALVGEWAFAGKGQASFGVVDTGILNPCSVTTVCNAYDFFPPPQPFPLIPEDGSATLCVCATGGTGDYLYYVASGNLPDGLVLDPITGCVTWASTPLDSVVPFLLVTFGVVDAKGDTAEIDCGWFYAGRLTNCIQELGNWAV